ncbi:hypothetical protein QUC31_006816 [Theobroma cacao]|uniref:Cation/H(+) antiporter 15 n=1 Tax=Theobroma cacao TaxID=3641 RepID=A0AB32X263_THECC|nr:PREDICTED: cation/H(+) antiporter 15 [Theobroma cacao]XP_017984211.1 PREDICTED: cation/H(+) antiporter 15 [Theobroma cacao]WRX12765.1 Cation/H+ exchanger - like 9 [Theobroma cacao]
MATGLQQDSVIAGGNKTILCIDTSKINVESRSIWLHGSPLNSATSLLLFQLSGISAVSLLFDVCLRPLGQSTLVSQIFGGMIFGPSFLGYNRDVREILFPMRSTMIMSTFAGFGIMFYLFAIGVKTDPILMVRPGRKAAVIGAASLFVTLVFSVALGLVLKNFITLSTSLQNSIMLIASSQALTGFPVIAALLDELKILNTDLGRLAVTSAMFCDLIGMSMVGIIFSMQQSTSSDIFGCVPSILSIVALVASIFVILRPRLVKMYYQTLETKSVDENSIAFIFLLVMAAAFLSEVIGQHYIFGPLVLGLAVPDGPPLGSALSSRLDTLSKAFLYPAYCALSGMQTDIFTIDFQSFYVVGIIVAFAFVIKLIAVMLSALFFGLSLREAFVLGLILNARGIVELTSYNLWKESELIEDQEFALVMMSVVIVTAVITPLIRKLYDPSKQYASVKRSTIHHAKRDSEFRIVVCLHSHESVPTIMNLLEVSHASRESPIAVTAMVLVELVGRSIPILVPNHSRRLVPTNSSTAGRVCNAFSQYEEYNQGCASVQSYTSISHFQTMHDDICRIAFEKRAHIVIVPFHKQWAIDGKIGSMSRPIQNLNINVLEKAPCSVGILIDRGVLNGFVSARTSSKFQVAVLFIGGPDDMESLAYGCRMVKHESVNLTVIRFLLFGGENSKDRKNDSHLINEHRQDNMGNERFLYVEEVLRDAEGLSSYIRGAIAHFHLILVGRYHPQSPLLEGLGEWSECPELGIVGDMLASPDYKTTATVLVIQQQRLGGKLFNHNLPFVVRNRDSSVVPDDLPKKLLHHGPGDDSLSISLDDFDTY